MRPSTHNFIEEIIIAFFLLPYSSRWIDNVDGILIKVFQIRGVDGYVVVVKIIGVQSARRLSNMCWVE